MKYYFKLLLWFFLYASIIDVQSQNSNVKEISIISPKTKQIKSIIKVVYKRISHSSKVSYWTAFDLVLAMKGDSLYIQITGINKFQNRSIFENANQQLYGCFYFKNLHFFVSTYKDQTIPVIQSMFKTINKKENVILIETSSIGIVENPLWLYQIVRGKAKLLKTVNLEYLE